MKCFELSERINFWVHTNSYSVDLEQLQHGQVQHCLLNNHIKLFLQQYQRKDKFQSRYSILSPLSLNQPMMMILFLFLFLLLTHLKQIVVVYLMRLKKDLLMILKWMDDVIPCLSISFQWLFFSFLQQSKDQSQPFQSYIHPKTWQ